jgi:hypothetical protein
MSAATWTPPRPAPPRARLTNDGMVLELRDPTTGTRRLRPVPVLQAEVGAWAKPSGTAAFPLHPTGVAELYRRAWLRLHATGALAGLTDAERACLERESWRVAGVVFQAGTAMRSALDEAASSRSLWPSRSALSGALDKMRVAQLAAWAAWAVFSAVCAWSQEV